MRRHLGPWWVLPGHARKRSGKTNHGEMGRKQVLPLPSATALRQRNVSKPNQKGTKRGNKVAWGVPEELCGLHRQQSRRQSEINKTNRVKEGKKGRWCVITRVALSSVISAYGSLGKHRGQLVAPGQSRAGAAKFLPKSQFQIRELPMNKEPWQQDGRSQPLHRTTRRGSRSAPPPLVCACDAGFLTVLLNWHRWSKRWWPKGGKLRAGCFQQAGPHLDDHLRLQFFLQNTSKSVVVKHMKQRNLHLWVPVSQTVKILYGKSGLRAKTSEL